MLSPPFPGSARNNADSYRCQGLVHHVLGRDYEPLERLSEVAARSGVSKSFHRAAFVAEHLRARLAGEDVDRYFKYLRSQAVRPCWPVPKLTDYLRAALFHELEHLPGHMQFYQQCRNTQWVTHCSPRQLMITVCELVCGGSPLGQELHAYLMVMRLSDVLAAVEAGRGRLQQGGLFCDLAVQRYRKEWVVAAQVLERHLAERLGLWYGEETAPADAPLHGLNFERYKYEQTGGRCFTAALNLALRGLRCSTEDPQRNKLLLQAVRADARRALTDKGKRAEARILLREVPELARAR